LAQEAREGLWKGHRVEVIPNGLSLETYRVQERNLAREALGIKACVPVILTAAQNISERRKGGKILIEALQQLSDCPFTLVTLGHGRLPERINDIQVHSLGYIDNERIKVLVYNAADLFVHPAPVDNLPNVVMEAIACGTPVVGFAIGGIKDMVRLGQTGWLTKEVSPEALAKVIKLALADLQQGVDLRLSCRSVAEAEYGSDLQAKRYIELFMSLIGGRKVTSS
jgi:glycosyltransferase involved in cell wall biosynthesis